MFIVRDIFQLKFGHFREARKLLEEASDRALLPESKSARVLSDFTGDSYRLIFEEGHDTLAEYEVSLMQSMEKKEWKEWYERFKEHVLSSQREILKMVF